MISRILVSGVSGPIGSALLPSLKARGYSVARLVRGATAGDDQIPWNPAQPIAPEAVSGFSAVIHLAGESIVGRWTKTKKTKIRDSRVAGTTALAQALARAKDKPRVFVCSSAIGYYGDRGDEVLSEKSKAGTGFLPDVCREWEEATQCRGSCRHPHRPDAYRRRSQPSRVARLGKMLTPFKMGVGGRIGEGRQWMSWIDVQDMVGAIHHILNSDLLHGPVNMVAPKPVTNAEFTKTLASVLSRPAILPMPAFAVKLALRRNGRHCAPRKPARRTDATGDEWISVPL